jgi:hypothetical protein
MVAASPFAYSPAYCHGTLEVFHPVICQFESANKDYLDYSVCMKHIDSPRGLYLLPFHLFAHVIFRTKVEGLPDEVSRGSTLYLMSLRR